MNKNNRINGYYSRNGYRIELNGRPIYTAGNHANNSQAYVSPSNPAALPLDMIGKFCYETAEDMASERGATFSGIELEGHS